MLSKGNQPAMSFYVRGSAEEDSLIVTAERFAGQLQMQLPAAALPWRDLTLVEKLGPRQPYGCCRDDTDPWRKVQVAAKEDEIEDRTSVRAAETLTVSDGVATIGFSTKAPLVIPCLRVADGARLSVAVRVLRLRKQEGVPELRVLQLSGGRRVGGVTLQVGKGGKR